MPTFDWAAAGSRPRKALGVVRVHDREQVGVGVEHAVDVADVPQSERRAEHGRVAKVAVAPVRQAGVVGDVPGGLLQVGHQPAPFQHLREEVGRLFARQVHPSQLSDGVIAVLEEDAVVELLGPPQPDGGVDRLVAGDIELADELFEEEASEAHVGP
jgi:hypothetical protein